MNLGIVTDHSDHRICAAVDINHFADRVVNAGKKLRCHFLADDRHSAFRRIVSFVDESACVELRTLHYRVVRTCTYQLP